VWAVLEVQGNPAFPVKPGIRAKVVVAEAADVLVQVFQAVNLNIRQGKRGMLHHIKVVLGLEVLDFRVEMQGRGLLYPFFLRLRFLVRGLLVIQVAVDQVAQTGQQEAVVR
jgi:hypothetical protein